MDRYEYWPYVGMLFIHSNEKKEYMGYIETWLVAEIAKARENTLLIAYTSIVKWEARSSAESKSGGRERDVRV